MFTKCQNFADGAIQASTLFFGVSVDYLVRRTGMTVVVYYSTVRYLRLPLLYCTRYRNGTVGTIQILYLVGTLLYFWTFLFLVVRDESSEPGNMYCIYIS